MKELLEAQPNLFLKQAEVVDFILEDTTPALSFRSEAEEPASSLSSFAEGGGPASRCIRGLILRDGRHIRAAATIVTTGTFLNGLIHCGEQQYAAGRSGEPASRPPRRSPEAPRPPRVPPQDRHTPAPRRTHHRLGPVHPAARRRRAHALLPPHPRNSPAPD